MTNHLERMRAKQRQFPAETVVPAERPKKLERVPDLAATAADEPALEPSTVVETRPRRGKRKQPHHERLPDGSRFDVQFDASAGMWSGKLIVPGICPQEFQGRWRTLFGLLSRLDRQYRCSLKGQATAKGVDHHGN